MCVLRASGPYGSLRDSVAVAPFAFKEAVAGRKHREAGASSGWTTFNFKVSTADGDKVPLQVEDTDDFLSERFSELRVLRESNGVEQLTLDFSWWFPSDASGQYNRFPCSLLEKCAALGIEIEVSVYRSAEGGGE